MYTVQYYTVQYNTVQNKEIYAYNYIPLQYLPCYCALNKLCAEMCEKDKDVKTQLRFGTTDIDVLTKIMGTKDPFKIVKISEDKIKEIPEFDFSIKWSRRKTTKKETEPLDGHICCAISQEPNCKHQQTKK